MPLTGDGRNRRGQGSSQTRWGRRPPPKGLHWPPNTSAALGEENFQRQALENICRHCQEGESWK